MKPVSARTLARQACFDCHSNETEWPAYASIAPVSWLVQHDVDEGRTVLNFSEWTRPQKEAKEAAAEVREGEMPPTAYRLIHPHARLSAADLDQLAQGLARTLGAAVEGRATTTWSPVPVGDVSRRMEPRCRSVIRCTIDSPSPLPVAFVPGAR